MIRSYNDHAANERTFLAWVRTALSTVALGIVVKKGSLLAVLIAGAPAAGLAGSTPDYVSDYGGAALVGMGIATMAVSAIRFVRTSLRIDEQRVHSAGIVRLLAALSRRRANSREAEAVPASNRKRNRLLPGVKQINLRLVGGTDVGRELRSAN